MLAEDRRRQIIERIKTSKTLSNAEIAEEFNVSMLTIRRDLELLEREGLIRRVYGGAQHISLPVTSKATERHLETKKRIATLAATLIQEGETVFIDAGTTALALAQVLIAQPIRRLSIVTHAVDVAHAFASRSGFRVFTIGGEILEETRAATGQFTLDAVRRLSYDRFFLGCMGFDVQNGTTTARMPEVEVKNAVIERANWVGLLADSSKWGVSAFATIAPIERCHCIVTDSGLGKSAQQEIRQLGVELKLA